MKAVPRLDFLAPAGPPRWPGVALLTAALAVAAVAATDLLAARRDVAAQERRLARWSAEAAPRRMRGADHAARADDGAAAAAAWRLAHARHYPWAGWLAGLESATPAGVRWLAAEHDRERGDVRLDGTAPDHATALAAVAALAGREGWSSVVPGRVSGSGGMPGATAGEVRFEVLARFGERKPAIARAAP